MDNIITPEALKQILGALEVKLDEKHQAALNEHIQATLEQRIGLALVELLEDDEVRELIALTEKGDQAALVAWLGKHVPDYQEVVQDEIDILLGEIAENSDQL
jgi:hypothetical protein